MGFEFLPIVLLVTLMPFVFFIAILTESSIQSDWVELHKLNGWEL